METESSTSAVLDQAAESPAGASQAPPEGSTPAKDGVKPGETPPAEGTSSQVTSLPDASGEDGPEPEKGKDVPHGQWLRMKDSRNKLRTTLQELSELGINSRKDAETLLGEVRTSETEARRTGIEAHKAWIEKSPVEFLTDLSEQRPAVYRRIAQEGVYDFIAAIERAQPEVAAQFRAAAEQFFGEGHESGRRAPQDSEPRPNSNELTKLQRQKIGLFTYQASAEFVSSFNGKLTELTKGLTFHNQEQKSSFFKSILETWHQAQERNELFQRQWSRIKHVADLDPDELPARQREAVQLHMKYVTDDFLRRLIEKARPVFGIGLAEKPPAKQDRTEVTGAGAPAAGAGPKDARAKALADIRVKAERLGKGQAWIDEQYALALYGVSETGA